MRFILYILIVFFYLGCIQKQDNAMLEKKYSFLIQNSNFNNKDILESLFNDFLLSRLQKPNEYSYLNFLKKEKETKLNDVILINKEQNKAVFMLMTIGLDNQNKDKGSVFVFSALKENGKWFFKDNIDMSFYYFTNHYNDKLDFDKISELSIKRMIKAGYMLEIDRINHTYIEDNWGTIFYK